jgi:hypothetical protein
MTDFLGERALRVKPSGCLRVPALAPMRGAAYLSAGLGRKGTRMADSVQMLGLCRFSYLAESDGFQTKHESIEARRAALFAPERLATRLFFLEHLLVPALRAQTDPDFTLVVLTAEDLPSGALARLSQVLAPLAQARIVQRPPGQHRAVCSEVLKQARSPEARAVAEFRLDDDDAVAVDFVEQTRAAFEEISGLWERAGWRAGLDFCKGFAMAAGDEGIEATPVLAPWWSPATVVFLRTGAPRTVMDFAHHRIWHQMPGLSLQAAPMFLRGFHSGNDSSADLRRTMPVQMEPSEIEELLSERFALDLAALQAAWAAHLAAAGAG